MKRDDDDNVILLPPHGVMAAEDRMPCRWCGVPTNTKTLALLGARCHGCYVAFCNEKQPTPEFMGDRRLDPKSWAKALKAREESGERLSTAQRQMWRAALDNLKETE